MGIYGIGYGSYGMTWQPGYGSVAGGSAVDRATGIAGNEGSKVNASGECQTCKNRKYVDGSDESVSFKTPGHISPESSAAVVRAHEQEHVANARVEGSKPNAELVSASVKLQTATCPECGRAYVAGGITTTTIKYTNEQNPYTKNQKAMDASVLAGSFIDLAG